MRILTTAITIGFGFVTLLALLLGDWIISPNNADWVNRFLTSLLQLVGNGGLLNILLQLVAITLTIMVLVGIANLLLVHFGRVTGRKNGAISSVILILSFVLVIATYIVQRSTSLMLLENVQVSIESALAALVLFALVYGAAGIMRRRTSIAGTLFVGVVLVMLIGALPLRSVSAISGLRDWLMAVPVNAGARGILLGIGLATMVAGVRVLIGQDRSYRE
ncbi:MAG TPA: hypothetical protein VHL11_13505 [Phototrophicaceae bacterium]|nr:hypothetical protein [Phototrophicaceae bacterium]